MPEYVTPEGFKKLRQDEIKAALEADFKLIFGDGVQLAPGSTVGQRVGVYSETIADIWDLLEVIFKQFDPGAVTGVIQDLLYRLNRLERQLASASTVDLEITGTPAFTVPKGFEASNTSGLTFATDEDAVIEGGGTVLTPATATVTGALSAGDNTLTIINNPLYDVTAVTNPDPAVLGRDIESDTLFRRRRTDSTAIAGLNLIESASANLANVAGVTGTRVYENKTDFPDPDYNNLPGHNWMAVVEGGDDKEIAQVIWLNTAQGIDSYGDEEVKIPSKVFDDVINTVHFQRPRILKIYVEVDIKVLPDFPGDGTDTIKQNIVDFAAGALIEQTGFVGFGIGIDIIYSRLYQPINLVQGHSITDLRIKKEGGAFQRVDILLEFDEKSSWDIEDIVVSVVS